MAVLVHNIDFRDTGNGGDYTLDGWGTPEGGHTWSIGPQSSLKFTVDDAPGRLVLVIRVRPWLFHPDIDRQRIVLGIDDLAIGMVDVVRETLIVLPLPGGGSERTLLIGHADSARSAIFDTYHTGQSMGLMFLSMHLFRETTRSELEPACLPPILGSLEDGSLPRAIEEVTGLTMARLMARFESLGEYCQFGKLQQRFGCDIPTLLRFAGLHMPNLVHGLIRRFEGIADPSCMTIFHPADTPDMFDVHDSTYGVWWHTNRSVHETTKEKIIGDEQVRMNYLQRKFAKTLQAGKRIFVITVPVPDDEALAVFLALDLWARNVLLFVTQDTTRPPGSVERLRNGVLRGTLDVTELVRRGSDEVWLSILANASLLVEER